MNIYAFQQTENRTSNAGFAGLLPDRRDKGHSPVNANTGLQFGYRQDPEKVHIVKRIGRTVRGYLQNALGINPNAISTQGGSERPSPRYDQGLQYYSEFHIRRRYIAEMNNILADDPLVAAGLMTLAHGAVGDDFTIMFPEPQNPDEMLNFAIAKKELELLKTICYKAGLAVWCEDWVGHGDVFVQLTVEDPGNMRISKVGAMPKEGMERLSNLNDTFDNPDEAYRQRDALTLEPVENGVFSDFQIVHGRFRKRPGDRYGRGLLFPSRQSAKDAIAGYATLLPRRQASHPKEAHLLRDSKGEPIPKDARDAYMEDLPSTRAKRGIFPTPFDALVGNGAMDIKIIEGNARFNELDDLKALSERALAPLKVPVSLISGSPTVNWATLDKQREELFAAQAVIAKHFADEVIMPIFNKQLELLDILPQTVPYRIVWGQRLTTEQQLLLSADARESWQTGLMSRYTAVAACIQPHGQRDVEAELARIDEERAKGIWFNSPQYPTSPSTGAGVSVGIPSSGSLTKSDPPSHHAPKGYAQPNPQQGQR